MRIGPIREMPIDLVCLGGMATGLTPAQAQFCRKITDKFIKSDLCLPFLEPVDPIRDGVPDYFTYVKEPMDLGTISYKLGSDSYTSPAQWKSDLMQVWKAAKLYNVKGTTLYLLAEKLQKKATKWTNYIPQTEADLWHMKLVRASHKISVLLNGNQPSVVPAKSQTAKARP
jgi:hypothetical protein